MIHRFILTMWYVNVILLWLIILLVDCFILTMWYVNDGVDSQRPAVMPVLY